jgi:hypothetical protein
MVQFSRKGAKTQREFVCHKCGASWSGYLSHITPLAVAEIIIMVLAVVPQAGRKELNPSSSLLSYWRCRIRSLQPGSDWCLKFSVDKKRRAFRRSLSMEMPAKGLANSEK